jgi:hypothetical protein
MSLFRKTLSIKFFIYKSICYLKTKCLWKAYPYRSAPGGTDASYSLRKRCCDRMNKDSHASCIITRCIQHVLRRCIKIWTKYLLNLSYVKQTANDCGSKILHKISRIFRFICGLKSYLHFCPGWFWIRTIFLPVYGSMIQMTWFWLEQPASSHSSLKNGNRIKKEKTIVLDLDETLVHSTTRSTRGYNLKVEVFIERQACLFYVYKRPFVDYFIRRVSYSDHTEEFSQTKKPLYIALCFSLVRFVNGTK